MRQMMIVAGCLIAAMPFAWIAANTASSPARGKEPRFPQLTLEELNDQQRPLGEKIVKTTKHAVSDALFDRARKLLGEQQVVDLTGVAGTYVGVAMILAMAEQGVPADKEPPFKEGEP